MEELWPNDQNDQKERSISEVSCFQCLFSRFGVQTSLERAVHHLHANPQKYLGTTAHRMRLLRRPWHVVAKLNPGENSYPKGSPKNLHLRSSTY